MRVFFYLAGSMFLVTQKEKQLEKEGLVAMENQAYRKIMVYECTCQRCGNVWVPRRKIEQVRMCPKCKSVRWDEPKKS